MSYTRAVQSQHAIFTSPDPANTEPEVRVKMDQGEECQYIVRNMGNFNLSLTHVLTIFHHVEQCCYPSVLTYSHIPAMTSHVAYVIYATLTLITTQGLCNITFSYVSSFSYAFGTVFFLCSLPFLPSHIHVALLTLYRIKNQVYLSTRNRSRLKRYLRDS